MRGQSHGRDRVRSLEQDPLFGDAIQGRGLNLVKTVTGQVVRPGGIERDKQDIVPGMVRAGVENEKTCGNREANKNRGMSLLECKVGSSHLIPCRPAALPG